VTGALGIQKGNTVLVTGGAGFVLSNVAKRLLELNADTRIVVLDRYSGDTLADEFLGDFGDRVFHVTGDIADKELLHEIGEMYDPTYVIHGAAITHQAQLEKDDPRIFIDVNLIGTVNILEWARSLRGLKRFIYVSTGGVYGSPSQWSTHGPQIEEGPFDPPELYAATKYAAELIVRRYRTLFGMDCIRVRLADIFGPMERATGARTSLSLPYKMMRAAVGKRPLRVSTRSMMAKTDILSAVDVSHAFAELLYGSNLKHDVFNISSGVHLPLASLFNIFRAVCPEFKVDIGDDGTDRIDADPAQLLARYNAYDISRMTELGWAPKPLSDQLAEYHAWTIIDPDRRCPSLPG
jgi:nucleoside-diphosphate-sugar epimerase